MYGIFKIGNEDQKRCISYTSMTSCSEEVNEKNDIIKKVTSDRRYCSNPLCATKSFKERAKKGARFDMSGWTVCENCNHIYFCESCTAMSEEHTQFCE